MKLFLAELIVLLVAATIVAAVVFRSQRATGALRFARRMAYAYVIGIVALAVIRLVWG